MPEPKSEKLESQVAREIDAYLAAIGLRVFRVDQGGGRFRRRTVGVGLPDRFGILPSGRWWAIEIKRPGARPRPNEAKQNEVLQYLRQHGALVIVAQSVQDVYHQLGPYVP